MIASFQTPSSSSFAVRFTIDTVHCEITDSIARGTTEIKWREWYCNTGCRAVEFSMHDPVFAEVAVRRINKWLELNKNIYRDKPTCVFSTVTSRWERPQLLTWPPRIRNLTQQLSDKHINNLHITSRPQTPVIFFFLLHTFFMFQKERFCNLDITEVGGYC
jgi:hypothetical protein